VESSILKEDPTMIRCAKCQHVFGVSPPSSGEEFGRPEQETTKVVDQDAIQASVSGSLGDQRISLAILSGPLAGQVFSVSKRTTIIGRAYGDVVLPDPELSRKHCQVEVRPDGVFLVDLGSTNGTYFDGKAIQEVQLEDKNEFVVGSTSVMLIVSSD